ncbi:hypothetical protein LTR85_011816 [Meristemomyces frigidus]|nr:hypothetical protein LTR85_011816 [Meristemomyces frigidus]
MPAPLGTTAQSDTPATKVMTKAFNIDELRLAVFSLLPARDLLRTQRVCRSWFFTITNERALQQRLFLAAGPGELVFPAMKGKEYLPGIQPRNKSQLSHMEMTKNPAMSGGGPLHLITTASGSTKEVQAADIGKAGGSGTPIIVNPFFTSLWPQNPTNMTSCPYITVTNSSSAGKTTPSPSWRRMQLTSPPILQVDLNLWYTNSKGKGNQLLPSTGKVPSGVTLGHLADLLAAQPKKLDLHWMQVQGHAWWVRSAAAVVVPKEGKGGGDNEARRGVYVNPSNGIAFPGAF